MHHLRHDEGAALANLALALRPDWERNNPGRILWEANEKGGFPHALDFLHMVRALLLYAAPGAGMRTPNLYPADGVWWRDSKTAALTTRQAAELATGSRRAMDIMAIDTTNIGGPGEHRGYEGFVGEGGFDRQQDRGLGYDHGVA